ncbi:hypothetical protein ACG33_14365 [Steroidobacter denitrificans]|uniref:Uncharacterized protein n=1 Tax=Steroidobacter denitrificans TaxID=465721 RepID=A0A127FEB6_STEDE|nr:hypothetical protein [Steroidobacter denitrificans]AMN48260.1 hypothetical protein ACG33_14365 [Steroidobacter denitrificans]
MAEPGSSKETMEASVNDRVATLLSRLVPDVVFDEPFESRFRPWYTEHSHTRIRQTMWTANTNSWSPAHFAHSDAERHRPPNIEHR